MFCASTTFLPSTTSMLALTYAAAQLLQSNVINKEPHERMFALFGLILSACVATIFAWPVCGVAFFPYAIWVLLSAPTVLAFLILFGSLGMSLSTSLPFPPSHTLR